MVKRAALVILAAAAGWLSRGLLPGSVAARVEPNAPPAAVTAPAEASVAETPPVAHVERVAIGSVGRSSRNLFAYREREVFVVAKPIVIAQQPAPIPPPPIELPVAAVPERFEYRYIGWFGPDDHRIAAFTRDGEVVTARDGERIGNRFVLRRINIESVDVETLEGVAQRIPIGR